MLVELLPESMFSPNLYPYDRNSGDGFDISSQSNSSATVLTRSLIPSFQVTATLVGTPANDTIRGRASDDLIRGLGGNDRLFGNGGDDTVRGDQGNDALIGGSGNDQLIGGSGNDTIEGNGGRDRLKGNGGDDLLNGGGNADILNGGGGQDVLDGGSGKDVMNGGRGNDILVARKQDIAKGGAGNDIFWDLGKNNVFTGGSGKDEFHFVAKDASIPLDKISIIKDFKPKEDLIYFNASEVSDFSQLTLSLQGSDTLISTENGPRLLAKGVAPDKIQARDIKFDTKLSAQVLSINSTQNASALTLLYSQPVANTSFRKNNYTLQRTSSDRQGTSSMLLSSVAKDTFSIKSVSGFGQIAASISVVPPINKEDKYTLTNEATDLTGNETTILLDFYYEFMFEINNKL